MSADSRRLGENTTGNHRAREPIQSILRAQDGETIVIERPERGGVGQTSPAEAELDDLADLKRCIICSAPSMTTTTDPVPRSEDRKGLPDDLPPVELCDAHWNAYQTDWLLLGWCDGHWSEALRYCEVHQRTVDPL